MKEILMIVNISSAFWSSPLLEIGVGGTVFKLSMFHKTSHQGLFMFSLSDSSLKTCLLSQGIITFSPCLPAIIFVNVVVAIFTLKNARRREQSECVCVVLCLFFRLTQGTRLGERDTQTFSSLTCQVYSVKLVSSPL